MPKVIEINGLPSMQLSGKMGSRYTRMKLEMLRDAVEMLPRCVQMTIRYFQMLSLISWIRFS